MDSDGTRNGVAFLWCSPCEGDQCAYRKGEGVTGGEAYRSDLPSMRCLFPIGAARCAFLTASYLICGGSGFMLAIPLGLGIMFPCVSTRHK